MVDKLPPDCTATPVGDRNNPYCSGNFYEPVYQSSTLKYVTTTPKWVFREMGEAHSQ